MCLCWCCLTYGGTFLVTRFWLSLRNVYESWRRRSIENRFVRFFIPFFLGKQSPNKASSTCCLLLFPQLTFHFSKFLRCHVFANSLSSATGNVKDFCCWFAFRPCEALVHGHSMMVVLMSIGHRRVWRFESKWKRNGNQGEKCKFSFKFRLCWRRLVINLVPFCLLQSLVEKCYAMPRFYNRTLVTKGETFPLLHVLQSSLKHEVLHSGLLENLFSCRCQK